MVLLQDWVDEKGRFNKRIFGTLPAWRTGLADWPPGLYKAPVAIASVYNWTGFYLGAQVGYAWGDNRTTEFLTATGLPPA